jgi:putative transposase
VGRGKRAQEGTYFPESDQRILGDSGFVERVLKEAEEKMEMRYRLRLQGVDLDKAAARAAEVLGMKKEEVWTKGRYRKVVEARSLFCYWAVRALGTTMSSLAVQLGISVPAVSKSVKRGEEVAEARGYSLVSS